MIMRKITLLLFAIGNMSCSCVRELIAMCPCRNRCTAPSDMPLKIKPLHPRIVHTMPPMSTFAGTWLCSEEVNALNAKLNEKCKVVTISIDGSDISVDTPYWVQKPGAYHSEVEGLVLFSETYHEDPRDLNKHSQFEITPNGMFYLRYTNGNLARRYTVFSSTGVQCDLPWLKKLLGID